MVKLLEGDSVVKEAEDEDEEELDTKEPGEKSRKKPHPATYEPDQRSMGWLKVKKGMSRHIVDTEADGRLSRRARRFARSRTDWYASIWIQLTAGAWWGMGRKAGWWSPILLAARNPDSGALEAVCKCKLSPLPNLTAGISGFSDAFYRDLLVRYPPEGQPDVCNPAAPLGYVETGGLVPDFWFQPREVWEIRGAELVPCPSEN